jgi:hypothetical protein
MPQKQAKLIYISVLGQPERGEAVPRSMFDRVDLMVRFECGKPLA